MSEAHSKTCLSVLDLITRKSTMPMFYCIFKGICLGLSLPRLPAPLQANSDTKASLLSRSRRPAGGSPQPMGAQAGTGSCAVLCLLGSSGRPVFKCSLLHQTPAVNEADCVNHVFGNSAVFLPHEELCSVGFWERQQALVWDGDGDAAPCGSTQGHSPGTGRASVLSQGRGSSDQAHGDSYTDTPCIPLS